jgi:hypothetical protein
VFGELNRAGCGSLFHASRQINRVANGFVVHAQVGTDRAHNHRPCVESHTQLQAYTAHALQVSVQLGDCLVQGQCCAHGPLWCLLYG